MPRNTECFSWYEDSEYSQEELDFFKAIDRFKKDFRRPFPTWQDVLAVIRSLGYRKVEESSPIPKPRANPASGKKTKNSCE